MSSDEEHESAEVTLEKMRKLLNKQSKIFKESTCSSEPQPEVRCSPTDSRKRSIHEELKRLYQPYPKPVNIKSIKKASLLSPKAKETNFDLKDSFKLKKVILLISNRIEYPPVGAELNLYVTCELIKDGVSISKLDSEEEVLTKLKKRYSKYLLPSDKVQILKKEGTKLAHLGLEPGEEVTGRIIFTVFGHQKVLYLRPEKGYDLILPEDLSHEAGPSKYDCTNSDEEDDPQPKSSATLDGEEDTSLLEIRQEHQGHKEKANIRQENKSEDVIVIDDDEFLHDVMSQMQYHEGATINVKIEKTDPEIKIEEVEPLPFQAVKQMFFQQISTEEQEALIINRDRVLQSAGMGVRILKFDPHKKLFVRFVDEWSHVEPGIDSGGPRKEFLRLVFNQIRMSEMFEGPDFAKNLNLNNDSLRLKEYKIFGMFCALAVAYDESPMPNFFSEELFQMILKGSYQREIRLEYVADFDVVQEVEAIEKCRTLAELQLCVQNSAILALVGTSSIVTALSKKESIIKDCLNFYINVRMQAPFSQLLEGLQTFNLLSLMREQPSLKVAFVNNGEKLSASKLKSLFHIDYENSESDELKTREQIVTNFFYIMHEIEAGDCECTLKDLLVFFTGSDQIPLGGYQCGPTIKFAKFNPQATVQNPNPDSNTCLNELILPINTTDYNELKEYICPVFKNARHLGRA